jgi:hypothetical protein
MSIEGNTSDEIISKLFKVLFFDKNCTGERCTISKIIVKTFMPKVEIEIKKNINYIFRPDTKTFTIYYTIGLISGEEKAKIKPISLQIESIGGNKLNLRLLINSFLTQNFRYKQSYIIKLTLPNYFFLELVVKLDFLDKAVLSEILSYLDIYKDSFKEISVVATEKIIDRNLTEEDLIELDPTISHKELTKEERFKSKKHKEIIGFFGGKSHRETRTKKTTRKRRKPFY